MRIATWNINNGDFAARLGRLVEQVHPDVAVITEAPEPTSRLPNVRWAKDSEKRGIAVYVSPRCSISPMSPNEPLHRCVHGYQIGGPNSFSLLACWSHAITGNGDYRLCWVEGIARYAEYVKRDNVVIAGDLNDNAKWDRDYPAPTLENIFDGFREKYNTVSVYHQFYNEKFGEETRHSLFLQKNTSKPYYVDYVLIPHRWTPQLKTVLVGDKSDWLTLSDHMPVVVEIAD
jgi:exonuclease III